MWLQLKAPLCLIMLMSPHLMLRMKSLFDVRLSLTLSQTLASVRINLPPLFFSFLALNAALRRSTRTTAGLNTGVVFSFLLFLTSDNTQKAVVQRHDSQLYSRRPHNSVVVFFKAWPTCPNTSASVWIQYSLGHGSHTRPFCVCHSFARQLF